MRHNELLSWSQPLDHSHARSRPFTAVCISISWPAQRRRVLLFVWIVHRRFCYPITARRHSGISDSTIRQDCHGRCPFGNLSAWNNGKQPPCHAAQPTVRASRRSGCVMRHSLLPVFGGTAYRPGGPRDALVRGAALHIP